jgi:cytosine/adenosine deaminase-related metal-dependent hydrolase
MRGIAASWVITGKPDEAPLADGAVVLDARGVVVAVGPAADLRTRFAQASWREERAILMPGLVNAHTHLELSALRGHTRSGGGFGPWVTSMMEQREQLHPEQDLEAIDAAVSELLRAGTAAIGEVTNTLASLDALSTAPLLGRVFHEIFGMRRETADAMRGFARQARSARGRMPDNFSYALAPHTLYSLHPEAAKEIVAEARGLGLITTLHLSEHAAERAYLRDASGPFAEFLRARKVSAADWMSPGLSPVEYAEVLGLLARDVLSVHLADATRDDLVKVAAARAPVVLCPRSNLFIELKLPPLYEMLALGIEPALGTDSLASNTSLDVLAEASALKDRFPQVEPLKLISMATWFGARALGLSHRVGALAEGLSPGLIAFDLAQPVADPARHVLRSPPLPRRVLERPALPDSNHELGERP